jgi:predicted phosphodiesterase
MGKIIIFGDIHVSDKYTGKHRDYFQNCMNVMKALSEIVHKEKPVAVVLAGDLVGVGSDDKNVRDRTTLMLMWRTFMDWNEVTNGNVYGVLGNHDRGGKTTDSEVFAFMGVIKYISHFDHKNLRVHFVNFGEEHRELDMACEATCHVAIVHNSFLIEGYTNWFRVKEGFELSSMKNFKGIDIVLAGHIHNPSEVILETSIEETPISLFYMGCPTRPKKEPVMWEQVFYPTLVVSDDLDTNQEVSIELPTLQLTPSSELFIKTLEDDGYEIDELMVEPTLDVEALADVLNELAKYALPGVNDYKSQLRRLAGIDEEAAELAISYVEKAEAVLG